MKSTWCYVASNLSFEDHSAIVAVKQWSTFRLCAMDMKVSSCVKLNPHAPKLVSPKPYWNPPVV